MIGAGLLWSRAGRVLLGLLVSLTILVGQNLVVATPAKALDVFACLNTFTGYRTGFEVVSEVADPEFAYCAGRMSGDPAMAAVVAIVVGAGQAGAFKDQAMCQNMLTGQLGKLIAYLLVEAGIADLLAKVLGPGFATQIVEFAQDQAVSNIASVPALQPIMAYLDCGCVMAGKADAAQQITKAFYEDVKACANGVYDIGKKIVEGIISGVNAVIDGVKDFLGFGKSKPPPHIVRTTYGYCDNWIAVKGDSYQQQPTLSGWEGAGFTSYGKPQTIHIEKSTVGGVVFPERDVVVSFVSDLYVCSCPLPGALETRKSGDVVEFRCGCPQEGRAFNSETRTCQCNANEWRENGVCTSCSAVIYSEDASGITGVSGKMTGGACQRQELKCASGQTPRRNYDGYLTCQNTCPAGTFNSIVAGQLPSQGQCVSCPANSIPKAGTGNGEVSAPQCEQCPYGTAASSGALTCRALQCPGGIDPNNPHACRQACRTTGEGINQRVVCDGPAIAPPSVIKTCPSGAIAVGDRCIGPHEAEPSMVPLQPGLNELVVRPPVRMEPILGGPSTSRPPSVSAPPRPPVTVNNNPPRATPVLPRDNGGATAIPALPQVVVTPEQLIDFGRIFEFTLPGSGSGVPASPERQSEPAPIFETPSTDFTPRYRDDFQLIPAPGASVERVYN